ncbi:MAG: biotin/lipoyl-containing protein [Chloroflexota bacterium]
MKTEFSYQVGTITKTVQISEEGDRLRIAIDGTSYQIEQIKQLQDQWLFEVDGQAIKAKTVVDDNGVWVAISGKQWHLPKQSMSEFRSGRSDRVPDHQTGNLVATMPGQVLDILVAPGDVVDHGQTLVILEAMKMELRIVAPFHGFVQTVDCTIGDTVDRDQSLVTLDKLDAINAVTA